MYYKVLQFKNSIVIRDNRCIWYDDCSTVIVRKELNVAFKYKIQKYKNDAIFAGFYNNLIFPIKYLKMTKLLSIQLLKPKNTMKQCFIKEILMFFVKDSCILIYNITSLTNSTKIFNIFIRYFLYLKNTL